MLPDSVNVVTFAMKEKRDSGVLENLQHCTRHFDIAGFFHLTYGFTTLDSFCHVKRMVSTEPLHNSIYLAGIRLDQHY